MADKIKDLLDNKTIDGASFAFTGKKGMDMMFNVSGDAVGKDDAVSIVKKAIKSTEFGKGIYFSVAAK